MEEWAETMVNEVPGVGEGVYAGLAEASQDRREGSVFLLDCCFRE